MTKEDKELLLKDLCARLPYGVKVQVTQVPIELSKDETLTYNRMYSLDESDEYITVKPYLRQMSSMTEEEGKELEHIFGEMDVPCWVDTYYGCLNFAGGNDFIDAEMAEVYTDWLNKKMFDYRGLIEKGLSLEAPEGMYQ